MFGKAAIIITHGQRVLPAQALELGYKFRYPTLTSALDDLTGPAVDLSEEATGHAYISGMTGARERRRGSDRGRSEIGRAADDTAGAYP